MTPYTTRSRLSSLLKECALLETRVLMTFKVRNYMSICRVLRKELIYSCITSGLCYTQSEKCEEVRFIRLMERLFGKLPLQDREDAEKKRDDESDDLKNQHYYSLPYTGSGVHVPDEFENITVCFQSLCFRCHL
jgi:hypothetical protein